MMLSRMGENVASLDFEKLVTLWHNALTYKDPRKGGPVRDIVEQEWIKREIGLPKNSNEVVPETGLLAALGYRVGSTHGKAPKLRHAILARVFNAGLPFVHSRNYMAQWGEPNSWQRRRKLENTLVAFIESKNGQSCFGKAVKDWSEDLEYLRNHIF